MTKPTTEELKDLLGKVTKGEWVAYPSSEYEGLFVESENGYLSDSICGDIGSENDATLIALAPTLAAEVVRLREALADIAGRHIPDQPAAYGGDESQWATRQHTELRRRARQALDADGAK